MKTAQSQPQDHAAMAPVRAPSQREAGFMPAPLPGIPNLARIFDPTLAASNARSTQAVTFLKAQRDLGNAWVNRQIEQGGSLTGPRERPIASPDSTAEREASVLADHLTGRSPMSRLPQLQREARSAPGGRVTGSVGSALPSTLQRRYESMLGADLTAVRVHDNPEAHGFARSIGAKAAALGSDIYFGRGRFDPATAEGQHLLAHEVAHTLQRDAHTKIHCTPDNDELQRQMALKKTVSRLRDVEFGHSSGSRVGPDSKDAYDHAMWREKGIRGKQDFDASAWLVLRSGTKPAQAIEAIFDNLSGWSFDCAEFCQIVLLKTLLDQIGPGRFNELVRKSGRRFELRDHGSTLIGDGGVYHRDTPFEGFRLTVGSSSAEVDLSEHDLLKNAAIGDRVSFTNLGAHPKSDFRNENVLKVGDDQYAAHGFEEKDNIFTEAQIRRRLAEMALAHMVDTEKDRHTAETLSWLQIDLKSQDTKKRQEAEQRLDDAGKQWIFVSQVQHYRMAWSRLGAVPARNVRRRP